MAYRLEEAELSAGLVVPLALVHAGIRRGVLQQIQRGGKRVAGRAQSVEQGDGEVSEPIDLALLAVDHRIT